MTEAENWIEIRNERTFSVNRQTLYSAYADPAKLAEWWGPHGFTNRISVFDLKPGGMWLITMTASNGTDFENHWTFEEIDDGRRIVARHHEPVHVFTLDMTFSDHPDGSRIEWLMIFDRTEENEEMEKFLHAANEQNLDRLAMIVHPAAKRPA
ncbi:ATPase [Pseudohoeflea suaedae]|uniref:ATPase n=1 Tax=Pseudohoeflea suaedae TaxID=877384 RepID=A0A4R5PII3_9HYPH|nr:SRPBCC domain-containing protein [Pseudohoeflea suaedae]TDH34331.1 ATPase [Pseudohoeflea suaedae]